MCAPLLVNGKRNHHIREKWNINNVIKIEKIRYEKKVDNYYSTMLHKLILTTRHHIIAHLNYWEKIESKQIIERKWATKVNVYDSVHENLKVWHMLMLMIELK